MGLKSCIRVHIWTELEVEIHIRWVQILTSFVMSLVFHRCPNVFSDRLLSRRVDGRLFFFTVECTTSSIIVSSLWSLNETDYCCRNVNGIYRIGLFALTDISPGDELTYDYNFHSYNLHSQVRTERTYMWLSLLRATPCGRYHVSWLWLLVSWQAMSFLSLS